MKQSIVTLENKQSSLHDENDPNKKEKGMNHK